MSTTDSGIYNKKRIKHKIGLPNDDQYYQN